MSLNILISNDDGYSAPGIRVLADELASLGRVRVIAPDGNRSGASNSLTLHQPIAFTQHEDNLYSVDGTPADCLQVAFGALDIDADLVPDIVVSGINNGPNMADDTLYSGTVGAAMEGRALRLPPIAVSMATFAPTHYATAAKAVANIIRQFVEPDHGSALSAFSEGHVRPVLNVNVPDIAYSELAGMRITRLGRRFPPAAATLLEQNKTNPLYQLGSAGEIKDRSEGTDFHAVENGFVSITPLQTDLTNLDKFAALSELLLTDS